MSISGLQISDLKNNYYLLQERTGFALSCIMGMEMLSKVWIVLWVKEALQINGNNQELAIYFSN